MTAVHLCMQPSITHYEKESIKKNYITFISIYQGTIIYYFQNLYCLLYYIVYKMLTFIHRDYGMIDEEDRSSIFLISFHYLLHVVESIEDFGPCRGYWQFPMERMCGMLIPLVKSQVHPYANLWNNLMLNERFNHLKYMTKFYEHIFPSKEEKQWPSHRVFTTSLYQEFELYSPSKKYVLSTTELTRLKETYSAIFDVNIETMQVKNFINAYVLS